jgi:hypothetical protein
LPGEIARRRETSRRGQAAIKDGGAQFSVQPGRSRLTCGRGRERKIERASCLCHEAAIALSFPAKINAGVVSQRSSVSALQDVLFAVAASNE